MGMAKAKMNDREAARQFFIKAADRESQNPLLVANILNVMYHLVGPNEVRDYCNQKLAEDPNSVVANYVLYNVAKLGGDYNKAAAFMDKCIAISEPNSQGAMNLIIEKATLLAAAYQTYSDNNYCRQALDAWLVLLLMSPI
jgi:hypothetical protein